MSDPNVQAAIAKASLDQLDQRWDAIVIGAGAAGGLAAEELTTAGLSVLVLDAGQAPSFSNSPIRYAITNVIRTVANPGTLPFLPARVLHKGRQALRIVGGHRQPTQTLCYAWERMPHAFVDDIDCPYSVEDGKPFNWIRARVQGGRVIIPGHGRQYLRFGPDDFDGRGSPDAAWPLGQGELDEWYTKVERRLGMRGVRDNLPWLPDSEITHPLTPTAAEDELMALIKERWPNAAPIMGRYAPPADTLAGAAKTGRLAVRTGAIAQRVAVEGGQATGVHWFDQQTGRALSANAPIVFLCASALESTRVLMMSSDESTGRAIGSQGEALGRHLMDHVMIKAEGIGPRLPGDGPEMMEDGRCVYLPRFDSRDQPVPSPQHGFGVQAYRTSVGGGQSFFTSVAFSEMLPNARNRVSLHPSRTDKWGMPILHIDCAFGEAERELARGQTKALEELADVANVSLTRLDDAPMPPGTSVHECGTARMGRDPQTSVLDPHNQCWDAKGLYLTDSASFPSQGSQNPTLTVMALTARACRHALGAN